MEKCENPFNYYYKKPSKSCWPIFCDYVLTAPKRQKSYENFQNWNQSAQFTEVLQNWGRVFDQQFQPQNIHQEIYEQRQWAFQRQPGTNLMGDQVLRTPFN